jgi:ATP-binding cassette subfamily B (MDR/TAP) protein 1
MKGDIELEDVCFSYPTRPDRLVFDGFNLVIPAGKCIKSCSAAQCFS